MFSLLSLYAREAVPPETRLRSFVASDKRLTWVSLLLTDRKEADVYLVGGAVRDALRGASPTDVDLVVRGIPLDELEAWLNHHGAASVVGRFGTIKFIPHGCGGLEPLDIALPRTEHIGEFHNSSRTDMQVKFSHKLAIEEDLGRRDFTVNAMAYEIGRGRLIDPFLGLKDLHAELINAVLVPEQRFYEDATRILRGLRLACQLRFAIEESTWRAMQAHIKLLSNTITTEDGKFIFAVPREAIGKEFLLGFVEHPTHTLRLWSECGALHLFLPQLTALETEHLADFNRLHATENLLHLLHNPHVTESLGLKRISPTALIAGLMAFIDDDGAIAKGICVKWHFHQLPSDHRAHVNCEGVYWLLEHLRTFESIDPANMRPSQFEKLFSDSRGAELLALMQSYYAATGNHHIARERVLIAKRMREKLHALFSVAAGGHPLPRLLSGHDLETLGIPNGPRYRELFDLLRDQQLLGGITTKESALAFISNHIKK